MKVKMIKSAIVLSFYSFLNIVFIVFLASSSLSFALPQDKPKVNMCEFSFDPLNKRDLTLKRRIQKKIRKKLQQSKEIESVQFITATTLSRLGNIEEYCKRQEVRYIIEGQMEDILEDQIRVKIVLKDMEIKGDNKEKFGPERTLRKDLETTEYWFDKVSEYICSYIEGKSIQWVVYTYCFKIVGDADNTLKEIKLLMPEKLKTSLEDKGLGPKYILDTFRTRGAVVNECEKGILGRDLNVHEFVIKGEILPDSATNEYEVTVEIVVTDKTGDDVLIKGFKEKYSPNFFVNLAERIRTEWSQKIDK